MTPSGKVTFEVANYAGAEYKTEDSDEQGNDPWESDRSKGRLPPHR